MYYLSFSLCGHRKFCLVQDLNIICWTLQTKYEIPNIILVQARPVTQMDCLSSPKAWSLEKNLWKYQISRSMLLYFRFGLSFCYSDLVQGRTNSKDSGHFIEVWCVPSSTCEWCGSRSLPIIILSTGCWYIFSNKLQSLQLTII